MTLRSQLTADWHRTSQADPNVSELVDGLGMNSNRLSIRLVGAGLPQVRQVASVLEASGLSVSIELLETLEASLNVQRFEPWLVIVDGLQEQLRKLPEDHDLVFLTFDPRLRSKTGVIPAYAPGVLESLAPLLRRRCSDYDLVNGLIQKWPTACVVLDRSGIVLDVNEAAQQILEKPAVLGRPFEGKVPDPGCQRIRAEGNSSISLVTSEIRWFNEPAHLVQMNVAAGADSFAGRLAHADRLAAVGALAAAFAHEINNPAQMVGADLTQLMEQLRTFELVCQRLEPHQLREDGEKAIGESFELLRNCFDGLSRITSIIRDLKSFSRVQSDKITWVHPNEVINQACSIANNQIRHRGILVKELEADKAFPGDCYKLVQVVTNLLVNANHALCDNKPDQRILVKTYIEDGYAVMTVADNGTGIPRSVLGRIFEPFYTTKGEGEGTGLGLAMSLDIARQHGGTIEVDSEPDMGTRFDLKIPLENGFRVPEVDTKENISSTAHRHARVLLVDDEPGILRSLARLIERRHTVVKGEGGRAALELLQDDQAFDVIICDLMMPEVDGPMLFEKLASLAPQLCPRVVFMSGGAFTHRAQSFLRQVSNTVLDKPVPAASLEAAIQKAMM